MTIPYGVAVYGHCACAIFPVSDREKRLHYTTLKCVVPYSDELIVEYQPGSLNMAEWYAERLELAGYRNVSLVEAVDLCELRHSDSAPVA